MKKYIFIGLVVFLLLAMMSAGDKKKKEQQANIGNKNPSEEIIKNNDPIKEEAINDVNEKFLLGIGYFPFNSKLSTNEAMAKIKEASHIAYIQRHWQESQNSDNKNFFDVLKNDVSEARKNGLKVYIAFEVLSPDRDKLQLPSGMNGNFSSENVRSSYLDLVSKVAKEYKPEYFILNVEANMYKYYNPSDFNAFKTLYEEAYSVVKKANSKTKVGVSIVYNDYNEKDCFDSSDFARLKNDVSDFNKVDILPISTYPMCFITGSRLSEKFLAEIASVSDKPLFISETGWVSKGLFPIGSERNQANFVKALGKSASYAEKNGYDIEAINYVGLIDPSKQVCDMIVGIYPHLSWYCSLSLLDPDGNPKPAYEEMRVLKDSI